MSSAFRRLLNALLSAANSWRLAFQYYLIPLLLLGELILCCLIIKFIRYTPIDWKAYMQEVEGPLVHGNYNYSELRGETGPLVYPGGFVLLYGVLRALAGGDGSDIRPAQFALAACYVATLCAVALSHSAAFAISKRVPPWALLLLSTSLRLHSIYVLRLFNDGWAMLCFWVACALFTRHKWKLGCVFYSLGASIKANVLLSAPGLLLLLLQAHGLYGALLHISICALIQLILGLPFLYTNPYAYLLRALGGFGDLNHKWSVNYKFLPAAIFYSSYMPIVLLTLHLLTLYLLAQHVWTRKEGGLSKALKHLTLKPSSTSRSKPLAPLHPEHILTVLIGCNAVGVLFARSLHFQFYCWYLHGVPLLLWRASSVPLPLKLLTFALLEYAWSYGLERVEGTSTPASSACLQIAHGVLLYAVWRAEAPPTRASQKRA